MINKKLFIAILLTTTLLAVTTGQAQTNPADYDFYVDDGYPNTHVIPDAKIKKAGMHEMIPPEPNREQYNTLTDFTLPDPFSVKIKVEGLDRLEKEGYLEITRHFGDWNEVPENRYWGDFSVYFNDKGFGNILLGNGDEVDVFYEGLDVNITENIEVFIFQKLEVNEMYIEGGESVVNAFSDLQKAASQAGNGQIIHVYPGSYEGLNATKPLTFLRGSGPISNTSLTNDLSIKSSAVILGTEGQGFTVNGDVTIGEDTDAGDETVQVNRNILLGSFIHNGSGIVDALFNNWNIDNDGDGIAPDVSNTVTGSVLYSPWLLNVPGTENMTYKVASGGADPKGGLTRALKDANADAAKDEIIVDQGTYDVSDSPEVTESTDIVSCTGCPTEASTTGELVIDSSEVQVGERDGYVAGGFNIEGDVTVTGDANASTVSLNWNNINGTVTNNADGTLDATYNWWGDQTPADSTVGDVDYTPYLPDTVCSVLDYMEENGIDDPDTALAGMVCGGGSSSERAICELTGMGLYVGEAANLLQEYDLSSVINAMENADTSAEFAELLEGYSLPAGAAGGLTNNVVVGGAGSIGGRTVGAVFTKCETIRVNFPLVDFEGNPATNLTPIVSLVKLDENGHKKDLDKVTTASYEDEREAYVATLSSCELPPGYYQVQIDLRDESSLKQIIEIESNKAEKAED